MKRTLTPLVGIVAVALCIPFIVTAQTQQQLEQKHPKVNAYLVRPNLLLTAKFASDGRVCEMVLEPRRWTEEKVVLVSTLSEPDTIRVIEEIVPESERGNRLKGSPFDGMTSVAGGSSTTFYKYENMTIEFYGNTRQQCTGDMVAFVKFTNRSCSDK